MKKKPKNRTTENNKLRENRHKKTEDKENSVSKIANSQIDA